MNAEVPTHSTVPRGALIAAGLLVAGTLLATTAIRLSGVSIREPDAAAVTVRELRFEDRLDGSIAVIDARDERVVESLTGENGFVRGALRGLARDRKRLGIGPERAFELVGRADGRLTLIDPATQRRIDLESFGPTNASVFVKLLTVQGVSR